MWPKQVDKSFVTFTRDKFSKISGDDITVVTELLSTCLVPCDSLILGLARFVSRDA
jgi:hypothetical protein